MKQYFCNKLNPVLDYYISRHQNIIIVDDFNMTVENLLYKPLLLYLVNKRTFHQSKKAACFDLILTNKQNLFKSSNNFETDLSDHHMLISTIIKSGNFRGPPKKNV